MEDARPDPDLFPKQQRLTEKPLAEWLGSGHGREHGLYLAHKRGGKTITAIALELGLSVSRVSRLVAKGSKVQVAKDKD